MRIRILAIAMVCGVILASSNAEAATWPIEGSPLNSPFGPRCKGEWLSSFHAGVDIDDDGMNTPILAANAGWVYYVSPSNNATPYNGYHWTVILEHGYMPGAFFTGYHHIQSANDILVGINSYVAEGDTIAYLNYNHLHHNYWRAEPQSHDNTSHPFRNYSRSGIMELSVYDHTPTRCALGIMHVGQVLEVGVGIGPLASGPCTYQQVYNLETNVRSGGWESCHPLDCPGYCYYGSSDGIGIAPPNWVKGQVNTTFYLYQCAQGTWTLSVPYTYVKDVYGSTVYLQQPVNRMLESVSVRVEGDCVELLATLEEDSGANVEIRAWRKDCDGNGRSKLLVTRCGDNEYRVVDCERTACDVIAYNVECVIDDYVLATQEAIVEYGGMDRQLRAFVGDVFPLPAKGDGVKVSYFVPEGDGYWCSIYDVRGRRVRRVTEGRGEGGESIVWDARDDLGRAVESGCYVFCVETIDGQRSSKKIFITR